MYACVLENGCGFFEGGVHDQQRNRSSLRPTTTASEFATCSVPALQQVEHGSL